jgi:hypothetical protein
MGKCHSPNDDWKMSVEHFATLQRAADALWPLSATPELFWAWRRLQLMPLVERGYDRDRKSA